ncbi:hypothetical protein ZWY2020_015471 [Hordeum vulgare]|nr:hypothetical protein ZWY2020_015471 [Hordeum vulgare]
MLKVVFKDIDKFYLIMELCSVHLLNKMPRSVIYGSHRLRSAAAVAHACISADSGGGPSLLQRHRRLLDGVVPYPAAPAAPYNAAGSSSPYAAMPTAAPAVPYSAASTMPYGAPAAPYGVSAPPVYAGYY